jgi:hypothetical protein
LRTSKARWSIDPRAPKPLQTLHKPHTLYYRPPEESFRIIIAFNTGSDTVMLNTSRTGCRWAIRSHGYTPGSLRVVNCNMIEMEQLVSSTGSRHSMVIDSGRLWTRRHCLKAKPS